MAEFDTPDGAGRGGTSRRALAGYRQDGRVLADSDRGTERGARPARGRGCRMLVLLGGILGGLGGFGLEYWASTIAYPMNIGGRPLNSWPQFIPVTFETTVLGAALTCFIGMWALNKLPQPYHPVFNVPAFDARVDATASSCASRRPTRGSTATRRAAFLEGPASRWECPTLRRKHQVAQPSVWLVAAGWRRDWPVGWRMLSWSRARGACRQDMHDAPRYEPLEATTFFADGRASRHARGQHRRARAAARGRRTSTRARSTASSPTTFPMPVTARGDGARPGALQRVLLAVPRPHRHGQRHDRAARLPRAAVVPRGAAARTRRSATSSTS